MDFGSKRYRILLHYAWVKLWTDENAKLIVKDIVYLIFDDFIQIFQIFWMVLAKKKLLSTFRCPENNIERLHGRPALKSL
jgi:hypothetical protein